MSSPFVTPVSFASFDLGEWGSILLVECRHPESNTERWDLPLGIQCPAHHRTVYYCADRNVLWCDGYQGDERYVPHELGLDPRAFQPIGEEAADVG